MMVAIRPGQLGERDPADLLGLVLRHTDPVGAARQVQLVRAVHRTGHRLKRQDGLEIWCDVPLETARRRYEARYPRHPIHGDLLTDDEWERWRSTARPLEIGPVLRVDTAQPVGPQAITAWIQAAPRSAND